TPVPSGLRSHHAFTALWKLLFGKRDWMRNLFFAVVSLLALFAFLEQIRPMFGGASSASTGS
ncbi:hypothetical protein ACFOPQ_15405, partial [Deinococcus antarcticus]